MSLPKRALYSLPEAAARWNCQAADIADWAFAGHLELMIAIPPTLIGGEILCDLAVIAPGDILAMFRRSGTGPCEVAIRRVRLPGSGEWKHIHPPDAALVVTRDDLMITGDAVARFEDQHGIFRRPRADSSKSYDWEGFYGAMVLRIFRSGLPEKQADLIGEMQDWFIANSTDGDAPDESTIRKRISPIWRLLRAEA